MQEGWCVFVYMVLEDMGTEVEWVPKAKRGHTAIDPYMSSFYLLNFLILIANNELNF